MKDEEQKIIEMREQLDSKKETASELKGERAGLIKQLKDDGCKGLPAAEKEAKSETKKADDYRAKLKKAVNSLEEEYDWEE